jgi:hypothetical protein
VKNNYSENSNFRDKKNSPKKQLKIKNKSEKQNRNKIKTTSKRRLNRALRK